MLDVSHKHDSPPSSPVRRAGQDPFVDPSSRHNSAPPPFSENQLIIYDDKTTLDGHTSTNPDTNTLSSPTGVQLSQPPAPFDEEALAMDQAAQSLEEAAAQQTNLQIQTMLLRKAKKLRKKSAKRRGEHRVGPCKGVAGGVVLLVTVPLYIAGAAIEGTGTLLKASGMVLKGTGSGLKKAHKWSMDKFDL